MGQISFENTIDFNLSPNIHTPWEFSLGYAVSLNDGSKL